MNETWDIGSIIALIALIVSAGTLVFYIVELNFNLKRAKKESTLNAYKQLQNHFKYIKTITERIPKLEKTDEKEWTELTECLADIENFCVGVNTGVYDINILNRVGGVYFIYLFHLLGPVIEKKRSKKSGRRPYDEFEKTVDGLIVIRRRQNLVD